MGAYHDIHQPLRFAQNGGEGLGITPRPSFSTSLDYFATSLLVLVRFLRSLIAHSSQVLSLSIFPTAPAVKPVTPAAEPAGTGATAGATVLHGVATSFWAAGTVTELVAPVPP